MKYIKTGFYLGIGIALASIVMQFAGSLLMYGIYFALQAFQNLGGIV